MYSSHGPLTGPSKSNPNATVGASHLSMLSTSGGEADVDGPTMGGKCNDMSNTGHDPNMASGSNTLENADPMSLRNGIHNEVINLSGELGLKNCHPNYWV